MKSNHKCQSGLVIRTPTQPFGECSIINQEEGQTILTRALFSLGNVNIVSKPAWESRIHVDPPRSLWRLISSPREKAPSSGGLLLWIDRNLRTPLKTAHGPRADGVTPGATYLRVAERTRAAILIKMCLTVWRGLTFARARLRRRSRRLQRQRGDIEASGCAGQPLR